MCERSRYVLLIFYSYRDPVKKKAQQVSEELSSILKKIEGKFSLVRAGARLPHYHTVIITPQMIKLAKQEMLLKLEVAEAIRKAEKHLILVERNLNECREWSSNSERLSGSGGDGP